MMRALEMTLFRSGVERRLARLFSVVECASSLQTLTARSSLFDLKGIAEWAWSAVAPGYSFEVIGFVPGLCTHPHFPSCSNRT